MDDLLIVRLSDRSRDRYRNRRRPTSLGANLGLLLGLAAGFAINPIMIDFLPVEPNTAWVTSMAVGLAIGLSIGGLLSKAIPLARRRSKPVSHYRYDGFPFSEENEASSQQEDR